MGEVAPENNCPPARERADTVILPTEELRQALHRALTTEKTRALTDDDLAQMDATVSQYLQQQVRLNAQRARHDVAASRRDGFAWHRAWWFQVATAMAVLLVAGLYYWR